MSNKVDIENMTVKEAKELASMFGGGKKKSPSVEVDYGIKIAILQRGWVMVGRYSQKGDYITLKNAAVVRKWGTSKGLPELAAKGPLSDTVLDKGPDIRFHVLTEIASLQCEESKWSGKLEA